MRYYTAILCAIIVMALFLVSCSREEFGGLGIEVPSGTEKVTENRPFRIITVFEGGTGHGAGLKAGDIILSVDGRDLRNRRHDSIVNGLLRGKVGSIALLEIKRGDEVISYAVQRGKIVLTNE